MTYKQFIKDYINPSLTNDRGINNYQFACTIDNLHRDGLITDKQAQNWSQPRTLKFFTKEELKRNDTF